MLVPTTPGRSPVWALPRSLAATDGIEVSFCSSGYLDVSVPQVCFDTLCIQMPMTRRVAATRRVAPFGYPRIDACSSSPGLFAGNHVLLRRLTPRHSPRALHSLITSTCGRCSQLHDSLRLPDHPARRERRTKPTGTAILRLCARMRRHTCVGETHVRLHKDPAYPLVKERGLKPGLTREKASRSRRARCLADCGKPRSTRARYSSYRWSAVKPAGGLFVAGRAAGPTSGAMPLRRQPTRSID